MADVADLVLIYQFIKRLTTPFNKTEAYKLGLIDDKGKKLKKASTSEEKKAMGYFDRLVFNIKRLLEKLPGGSSRIASYGAALWLIKEGKIDREYSESEIATGLYEAMDELDEKTNRKLNELMEDAPANATGPAVAGTNGDVTWRKPDMRKKEMKAFLRRYMVQKEKRAAAKTRKDFLKRMGINEDVTQKQINDLEKFADRLLDKFDVDVEFTRHFADRMNDDRNKPKITIPELQRVFKKIAKNKAKNIKANPDSEAVLKDMQSDLNLPVVIKFNRDTEEFDIVNKTIMRKKDFKTSNKVIKY